MAASRRAVGLDDIDLVGFDNYLPLSDWTTATAASTRTTGSRPPPAGAWPPASATMNGLGLTGAPTLYSLAYLKANIEGGEKFDWFYDDGANDGPAARSRRLGPHRLAARGRPAGAGAQSLFHRPAIARQQAVALVVEQSASGGLRRGRWRRLGAAWAADRMESRKSKSICFVEYGFPACRQGDQPTQRVLRSEIERERDALLVDLDAEPGRRLCCRGATIRSPMLALQAIYEYWQATATTRRRRPASRCSSSTFSCVWNWDARPFPIFPLLSGQWGDAGDWAYGDWLNGRGPALTRRRPRRRRRPGPTRPSRRWRRSAGRHIAGRASPPTSPTTSRAATRGGRGMPAHSTTSN